MPDSQTPVIIAGGGPVGLSLALGLARQGVRSIIFEQAAELPPFPRAIVVLTRTLEVFQSWDVADAFRARGEFVQTVRPVSALTNKQLIAIDFSQLADETPSAGVIVLPQETTEKLLLQELRRTGMCEVRFNYKLIGATQDESGVAVAVAGENGETQEVRARFLVGADGAHSAVRAAMGLALEGMTYPAHVFLADVGIADERDNLPWPRVVAGERPRGAIRFEPGRWRVIGSLSPEQAEGTLPQAFLGEVVRETIGSGPYTLLWHSTFTIHRRHAKTFRKGRMLLAGDAGHLNSPAGGQGMNAGIQDAHNLAWKLAFALRGGNVDLLLDSYDAERHQAITEGVERLTEVLTRFGLLMPKAMRNPIGAILRRALSFRVFANRLVRAASMLNTGYWRSPLFLGKSSLLGKRAPQPELLVKYTPTLVLHRPSPDVLAAAHDLGIPDVEVVRAHDWRRWRCALPFAALVRPDGVVGSFHRNPSGESVHNGARGALGFPT